MHAKVIDLQEYKRRREWQDAERRRLERGQAILDRLRRRPVPVRDGGAA